MILHTVNKSPHGHAALTDCLRLCSPHSAVILIEDGVLAGKQGTSYQKLLEQRSDLQFYALTADVAARGLEQQMSAFITLVDDKGFVELVVQHHSVQSWY